MGKAISFIDDLDTNSEKSNQSNATSQESCNPEVCLPFIDDQIWVDITADNQSKVHANLLHAFKELREKFEPRLLLFQVDTSCEDDDLPNVKDAEMII